MSINFYKIFLDVWYMLHVKYFKDKPPKLAVPTIETINDQTVILDAGLAAPVT